MRTRFYPLAMLTMLAFGSVAAQADDISPNLSQYAVYSDGNISLNGRAIVTGNLGAGGTLTLQDNSQVSDGVFSGGAMSIRYRVQIEGLVHSDSTLSIYDDSVLRDSVQSVENMTLRYRVGVTGDATSEGSITRMDAVSVGGTTSQYTPLPHTWIAPSVVEPAYNPGGTAVSLGNSESRVLAPGSYGALSMRAGSAVSLSAGVYRFSSISSETDVRFLIDDSSGPVSVYVEQTMLLGDRATVVLDSGNGANLTWFVGGDLTIRGDSRFAGLVRCFSGVTLQDRVTTNGSIYAKDGFSCGWDCVFGVATSTTFFVATNGNDANSGTSMSAPLRTIQAAVNKCTEAGSVIYIAPGTYSERLQIGTGAGSGVATGTENEPIRVIGDVNGTNTNRNPGSVVLDGSNQYERGIELQGVDYWAFDGLSVSGFTQYGIYATGSGFSFANATIEVPATYGIYATVDTETQISACRFDRGATSGTAAWLQCAAGSSGVDLVFSNNDMTLRAEAYLSRNYAAGAGENGVRSSNDGGYGLVAYGTQSGQWGTVTVANNLFSDVFLPIYCYAADSSSEIHIVNNTISGCMYSIYAQAPSGSSSVVANNNIISKSYYGLMTSTGGSSTVSVTALLEHEITYTMSAYGRAYEFDIITGDPLFMDPPQGDYSLCTRSPGVDAGTMRYAPSTDFAGYSRPLDGNDDGVAQIDLGAFEQVGECASSVRVVQWREIGDDED